MFTPGKRLDVQRLRVLPVDLVANAAQAGKAAKPKKDKPRHGEAA